MDVDLEEFEPSPKSSRRNSLEREVETVNTKHCSLCGRNILLHSYATHRLHCERKEQQNITKQIRESTSEQNTCDNKEKSCKKKNKKKPVVQQEEDDFDSVIASFSDKNKRCNYSRCKDTNSQEHVSVSSKQLDMWRKKTEDFIRACNSGRSTILAMR